MRNRLNRLEKMKSKPTAPAYLVEALRQAREANGNNDPIPSDLDKTTVLSMLIQELPG